MLGQVIETKLQGVVEKWPLAYLVGVVFVFILAEILERRKGAPNVASGS